MPNLWTLSNRDIEWYAESATILERGRSYYRSGRVRDLRLIAPDLVRATVRGREQRSYRVEVWVEDDQVHSQCTCPYSWGVCKHVIAVLFQWLEDRSARDAETTPGTRPAHPPAPRRPPLRTEESPRMALSAWLETIPPDLLRDMLLEEIRINSAVEDALARWREMLRPDRLPRQIVRLLEGMRAASATARRRTTERLLHLLRWAKTFDSAHVREIARQMLRRLPELCARCPDADHVPLVSAVIEMIEPHVAAFAQDPKTARALVRGLLDLFLAAPDPVRALLEEPIAQWTGSWNQREEAIADVTRRIGVPDAGAYALVAKLCRLEGRLDEYAEAREKSLKGEADYLELFEHYLERNDPDRAMRVAERGIKALGPHASQLVRRLAALYQEWGEKEKARKLLLPPDGNPHSIEERSGRGGRR